MDINRLALLLATTHYNLEPPVSAISVPFSRGLLVRPLYHYLTVLHRRIESQDAPTWTVQLASLEKISYISTNNYPTIWIQSPCV